MAESDLEPGNASIDHEQASSVYWGSHASCEGPKETTRGEVCLISVVLDAGAQKDFSGIRVIIVSKETEELNNASIRDYQVEPGVYGIGSDSRIAYRKMLSQRRHISGHTKELLKAQNSHRKGTLSLPLCTVTFELIDYSSSDWSIVFQPETYQAPLRVIYDRVIPYSLDALSFTALVEFTSKHSFKGYISRVCGQPPSTGIKTHSIRIIPVSASRPPFAGLPLSILRNIALHAVSPRDKDFHNSLVCFGLVCKAWLPLLDLFYENLGISSPVNKFNATTVSRMLMKKPEKARLVQALSPGDYTEEKCANAADACKLFSEAYLTMLALATSVKKLTISSIYPLFFSGLMQVLAKLRQVEDCYIYPIPDIQTFTGNWPKLRKLRVIGWNFTTIEDSAADTRIPCNDKLEDLCLAEGRITGPQLLLFVPSPQLCLQRLTLSMIQGLLNHVRGCDIPCSAEGEEYAIDAVMPKMVNLTEAVIAGGGIVTLLAIQRKSASTLEYTDSRKSAITIGGAPQFDMRSIIQALEVTGWSSVKLSNPNMIGWDEGLSKKAQSTAKERNIIFNGH